MGSFSDRLRWVYYAMRRRCECPNSSDYGHYGARGISVCKEWRKSRDAFEEWALRNGFGDGMDLERLDNDKGYSPENCCFVPHAQNLNNRRNTLRIELLGKVRCLSEVSEITGIPMSTLKCWVYRHGKTGCARRVYLRLAGEAT